MKQFLEVKQHHPDAILFFRVGDFYEMFFDDAVKASGILQITLTSRNKNKKDAIPLCGFPHHSASGYISKLIRAGESVAICEQVEDPGATKGIVRREVVRVITPGTVIDPELLNAKENNYLAALKWEKGKRITEARQIGLACLDLSTGDFRLLATDVHWVEIAGELIKLAPKEILISSRYQERQAEIAALSDQSVIRFIPEAFFAQDDAEEILKKHFDLQTVASLGGGRLSLCAAGALLEHIQDKQKTALGNIATLRPITSGDTMRIHPLALRHLDLVPFSREQKGQTLFHLLDKTVTAMGGRLLKEWILRPLRRPMAIEERHAGVAFFYDNLGVRTAVRTRLKKVSDLERLIGRISLKATQPRDLIALKESVVLLPEIYQEMFKTKDETMEAQAGGAHHPPFLATLLATWDRLESVYQMIDKAIEVEPPLSLKDGGVIKAGYLKELDELRHFQKEGRSMLSEIELKERKRSGIESLKVRYNRVFGYYIEVSDTQLKKVPEDYIRKQTLTRAERFMTSELNELEVKLSGAKEAIAALENRAFEEIRYDLAQETARIQVMARNLAHLDLLATLAEVAHCNHYCRPQVTDDLKIRIIEGRHPVLEQQTGQGIQHSFIPNDTVISPPGEQLLILTGPNMAGKSTYMRQIALIVLMAQMGSYVPAKKASIGVVDQIFTRVGAQDALSEGMSTFMVEMTEMSQILRHATAKSLILLDEIGRGTSTFDGLSIAWAIAEYVHNKLGARTLFATHYHELTGLSVVYEGIKNYHVLVREWGEEIVFLRKMVAGGSDKSYGIQVGRLAGLPPAIIKRSKAVLKALEENAIGSPLYTHLTGTGGRKFAEQPDLFSSPEPAPIETESKAPSSHSVHPVIECHPVVETLQTIDTNQMTPMEALQLLADLSQQAKSQLS